MMGRGDDQGKLSCNFPIVNNSRNITEVPDVNYGGVSRDRLTNNFLLVNISKNGRKVPDVDMTSQPALASLSVTSLP